VALEQARRLTRRGHQISIVSSGLAGDVPFSETDGFAVHRVSAGNWLETSRGIPYPLLSPRVFPLLARLVSEHDMVLVHNHTYLGSVAATLVARAHRRQTILLQYNPFVQYRFPWNAVEHAADHFMGRYTLRSASRVLAISAFTRQYVQRLVPQKQVDLLPLGVDTLRFTPAESPAHKQALRRHLGIPERALVLLTVRRLVFRNGLDTLVDAARRLKDHGDIYILIAGSGPEGQAIQQTVRSLGLDNVRLMGFVPDDQLPDLYRAADAFVLPTRTGEGFGLVVLEAFASGIPCIATRGGGQEEVVQPGENGLLIASAAPHELAEAALALRPRAHRERMGTAARKAAVERDWERSVDKLEETLLRTTYLERKNRFGLRPWRSSPAALGGESAVHRPD
jgi:glycosyltransferase involved in cell wall biosynthesis